MPSHLRAVLIALASVPFALTATGSAAAATLTDPTPSVSESPSPSIATSVNAPPRTNLTAVVDPIAVRVSDGVRIRVGTRNSGPLSITAPAGQQSVGLTLVIEFCCGLIMSVKSHSACEVAYSVPPNPTFPPEPRALVCSSTRTLRVGETYWQSFVFPDLSSTTLGVSVVATGYADDPDIGDNRRNVVVRLGSSLPVTGPRTVIVAGIGLALVIAGTVAIWQGRRRRLGP